MRRLLTAVTLTTVLLGCNSNPTVPPMEPLKVKVACPVEKEVVKYDEYEGKIVSRPKVIVQSRVVGHLVKKCFEDGQTVEPKQLLFEIDPAPYEAALKSAEAMKARAEADLKLAKAEYARTSSLVTTGASSRTELDLWIAKQGTAEADKLKAQADIDRALKDIEYAKIKADITVPGRITKSYVDVGNLVSAETTKLAEIVAIDPMYVEFNVDQPTMHRYRKEGAETRSEKPQNARAENIPVEVRLDGESGYKHKGIIEYVDPLFNPGTGTVLVRGELPNPTKRIEDGMHSRVRVPVEQYEAVMVPEEAIGTRQGSKYVFVVDDKNVAQRKDVELAWLSDGMWVLKNPTLKPTDQVIVSGMQRVRDGDVVNPVPVK